jgi:tetratricopeptide (TPR) repeat protein
MFERFFDRLDEATAREQFVPAAAMTMEESQSNAAAAYVHARMLMAAGDVEQAERALDHVIQLEPAFASTRLALAELLIRRKAWQEADACLKALEKSNKEAAELYRMHLLKGIVADALSERGAAEAAYLRAAELAPHDPKPLYRLSLLYERAEDRQECESVYRRIVTRVDPSFAPAREKLVILLLNSDRRQEAEKFFRGFAKLGIDDAAAGRCKAMFNLADNRATDGTKRLEDYRADLWRLLEDYPDDQATLVALAMSYLATGHYDSAIVQAERAVEIDPTDIRAREIKATLESRLLRFEAAADTIRSLLEDRPRDFAYSQQLMELSMNVGDYDTVIKVLRELIARDDLRAGRGLLTAQLFELLQLDGRDEEAIELARQWLEEAPGDNQRREAYMATLNDAERYDEAIAKLREWLAEDPGNARLRRTLISLLQSADRQVEAQQQVLEWMARTPDDVDLNRMLIALFWANEEWDAAVELARICAELPETEAFYEDLLAKTYIYAKRYNRAIELLKQRASETQTIAAYSDLIALLIQAERLIEAEQIASKILMPELVREEQKRRYDPALIVAMRQYLSRIYQLLGRNDDAIQQLEAIHRITPNDPGINNDLGYTYLEANTNLDEAERMIRMAVGELPRQPAYLDSLGWLLYKRGRFEEGVIYLQRAVDFSDSGDPVMYDHLGDALYRAGRHKDAEAAWREAARLCEPESGRTNSPEDEAVAEAVRRKLAQLAADEPVQTAALVGESTSTTQPSSRPAKSAASTDAPEPDAADDAARPPDAPID